MTEKIKFTTALRDKIHYSRLLHNLSYPQGFFKQRVPIIKPIYTNGLGNNIFQYAYSRVLAEHLGARLDTKRLPVVGNKANHYPISSRFETIIINPSFQDWHALFDSGYNKNILIRGFPEDYTLYLDKLDKIRSWFPPIPRTNTKDLVFHLRLGDRLFYPETYDPRYYVPVDKFVEAIHQFSFERLYIATDMPTWDRISLNSIKKMRFHVNPNLSTANIYKNAIDYFNEFYLKLAPMNPIVRTSTDVVSDFNFMRTFDQILFQHGTLAWWAAVISKAARVGVYGPWRPFRNHLNRNLSQINLPGWFQWQ